jgi:AraC-like DNA-binding protein
MPNAVRPSATRVGTLVAVLTNGASPPGVRVTSHEGGDHAWTMASRTPDPALAGVVARRYCGYVERADRPLRRREVATGCVSLIVSFGDPIDLVEMSGTPPGRRRLTSFVAGLHDGFAITEYVGPQCGVQVDLTPLGARRLLGAPHEIAGGCVAFDDVLGRAGRELTERLADAPDWAARFELLDRELVHRLAEAPQPDRAVEWAWHQLERTHGRVPITVLADEIGWSRRHFADRFRADVGLPPKPVARVLRFRRAVDLLTGGRVGSLADVAAASGYADHSHLVREFRALGGCTPSEFAGAQLPQSGGVAG